VEKSVQLEMFPDLPSWEERLKARQESLSGVPADGCLMTNSPEEWHRELRRLRMVVAATCASKTPGCDACLRYLQKL